MSISPEGREVCCCYAGGVGLQSLSNMLITKVITVEDFYSMLDQTTPTATGLSISNGFYHYGFPDFLFSSEPEFLVL
jgi:hypothetical protein